MKRVDICRIIHSARGHGYVSGMLKHADDSCLDPRRSFLQVEVPCGIKNHAVLFWQGLGVSTSVFCLPGDDILLSKKMARNLREKGVPEETILEFQANPYILDALCKSFVRYTKFAAWIGNYGVKDPADISSIILRRPMLLKTPIKYLEKNMQRYGMLGVEGKQLGKMALENPSIMSIDHKMLMGLIKRFRRVGVSQEDLCAVVTVCPSVLSPTYELQLSSTVEWLVKELDLGAQKTRQAILQSPWLLDTSQEDLSRKKAYFRSHLGLTVDQMKKMVHRNPAWIGANMDTQILPKVEYFKRVYKMNHPCIGNLFATQPGLILRSIESLEKNREYLLSLGLSSEDLLRIALKSPSALYIDLESSLKRKVQFLVQELQRPVADIIKYPGYLACRTWIILLRAGYLGARRSSVNLGKLVDPSLDVFIKCSGLPIDVFRRFESEWIVPPKWKCFIPFSETSKELEESANVSISLERPKVYREGTGGYW